MRSESILHRRQWQQFTTEVRDLLLNCLRGFQGIGVRGELVLQFCENETNGFDDVEEDDWFPTVPFDLQRLGGVVKLELLLKRGFPCLSKSIVRDFEKPGKEGIYQILLDQAALLGGGAFSVPKDGNHLGGRSNEPLTDFFFSSFRRTLSL